jgi:hypothetical protein
MQSLLPHSQFGSSSHLFRERVRRRCVDRGGVTTSRLRPGRQVLQRKHREENLLSNRDALDYLREVGVDRVQCMIAYAKVCGVVTLLARCCTVPTPCPPFSWQASEYLFYQSLGADDSVEEGDEEGEEGQEVAASAKSDLTLAQVKGVVEWLRSAGVPPSQVPAVIGAHPTLLAYDVETRLAPLSDFLTELGVSGDQLATALQERPSILGLSADKNMRVMVDYLLSTGKPKDEVIGLLLKSL